MTHRACLLVLFVFAASATADEPGLVARWPLARDAKDAGPNGLHAENRGVVFNARSSDGGTAAAFDGRGAHLVVPAAKPLSPGKGDFTISLRVNTAELLDDDLGDLVTWYDPDRRV